VEAEGRDREASCAIFPPDTPPATARASRWGFHSSRHRDGAPETFVTVSRWRTASACLSAAPNDCCERAAHLVMRYRTTRQIEFGPATRLYWNATGTGLDLHDRQPRRASIASACRPPDRVSTPAAGRPGQGPPSSSSKPGRIVFRTTRPLPPRCHRGCGLWQKAWWSRRAPRSARWWLAITSHAGRCHWPCPGSGLLSLCMARWGAIRPRRHHHSHGSDRLTACQRLPCVRDREGFVPACFTAAIIDSGLNGHLSSLVRQAR